MYWPLLAVEHSSRYEHQWRFQHNGDWFWPQDPKNAVAHNFLMTAEKKLSMRSSSWNVTDPNKPILHLINRDQGLHQRPCTIRRQLSPKREIALSAVPRYWELELMLLPSIKYDFTILEQLIMTLILLKTIHTLHHKNQKNRYWRRFTSIFYRIICWLVINTF